MSAAKTTAKTHTRLPDEITDHRYGWEWSRSRCSCGWVSQEANGPQSNDIQYGWHVVEVQP